MKTPCAHYAFGLNLNRSASSILTVLALGLALGSGFQALGQAQDSAIRSPRAIQIVAAISDPDPSGIVVSPEGRLFLGFPRHAVDHRKATLAEYKHGQLHPFPNAAMSQPSDAAASDRLISVHGMTLDTKDRLWVIDDGKRAGHPILPGGAKVMGFDLKTGVTVGKVVLAPPVLLRDSHMNDLRVDLTHGTQGTVYIADSSFGNFSGFGRGRYCDG